MTPAEAVERLNVTLAHLWMVRTFLKHSDDIQEDEELLDVPRTLYDSIRAVEPAYQRGDVKEYLRRLKGKLPKLRKLADFFAREYKRASSHTNFEMAALSLTGAVSRLEEIFAAIRDQPMPSDLGNACVELPSDAPNTPNDSPRNDPYGMTNAE